MQMKKGDGFVVCCRDNKSVINFTISADVVRIIKAGGFYINYQRVTDPEKVLIREHDVLPNNLTLIRVGKLID